MVPNPQSKGHSQCIQCLGGLGSLDGTSLIRKKGQPQSSNSFAYHIA